MSLLAVYLACRDRQCARRRAADKLLWACFDGAQTRIRVSGFPAWSLARGLARRVAQIWSSRRLPVCFSISKLTRQIPNGVLVGAPSLFVAFDLQPFGIVGERLGRFLDRVYHRGRALSRACCHSRLAATRMPMRRGDSCTNGGPSGPSRIRLPVRSLMRLSRHHSWKVRTWSSASEVNGASSAST